MPQGNKKKRTMLDYIMTPAVAESTNPRNFTPTTTPKGKPNWVDQTALGWADYLRGDVNYPANKIAEDIGGYFPGIASGFLSAPANMAEGLTKAGLGYAGALFGGTDDYHILDQNLKAGFDNFRPEFSPDRKGQTGYETGKGVGDMIFNLTAPAISKKFSSKGINLADTKAAKYFSDEARAIEWENLLAKQAQMEKDAADYAAYGPYHTNSKIRASEAPIDFGPWSEMEFLRNSNNKWQELNYSLPRGNNKVIANATPKLSDEALYQLKYKLALNNLQRLHPSNGLAINEWKAGQIAGNNNPIGNGAQQFINSIKDLQDKLGVIVKNNIPPGYIPPPTARLSDDAIASLKKKLAINQYNNPGSSYNKYSNYGEYGANPKHLNLFEHLMDKEDQARNLNAYFNDNRNLIDPEHWQGFLEFYKRQPKGFNYGEDLPF